MSSEELQAPVWPLSHRRPREADTELPGGGRQLQVPTLPWLAAIRGWFSWIIFFIDEQSKTSMSLMSSTR